MTPVYLWAKFIKKLPLSAIRDSAFEKPCKINSRSTVIGTTMGRYSYCGYDCTLINCQIGRYCSIADGVSAGLASHPADWVSTSPAFHLCAGRSVPRDLAALPYDPAPPRTVIGNDVWIGKNVLLKPGITIGDGAIIGMGSVVTKNVPPYAIVAGAPARFIRGRFPLELAERLEASRWWEMDPAVLKEYTPLMNDPEKFLAALEAKQ